MLLNLQQRQQFWSVLAMTPVSLLTIPMPSHTLNFLLTLAKKLLKVMRIDILLKVLAVGPGAALLAVFISLERVQLSLGTCQF